MKELLRENLTGFKIRCSSLPDTQLREMYNKYRNAQKRMAKIPVITAIVLTAVYLGVWLYCGSMVIDTNPENGIQSVQCILDFWNFAFCSSLFVMDNVTIIVLTVPVYVMLSVGKFYFFESLTVWGKLFLLCIFVCCIIDCLIVKRLDYMKTMDTFPFDPMRIEAQFEGMTRKQMAEYLQAQLNGGTKVMNYDTILSKKNEQPSDESQLQEDFLQQNPMDFIGTDVKLRHSDDFKRFK